MDCKIKYNFVTLRLEYTLKKRQWRRFTNHTHI